MPNDDYNESLHNSVDNLVELPTGQKEFGDLGEFHRVVDFFADRYGLGGFKNLEEFADMIDNTDPVLINGLYNAGIKAENKKWGGDEEEEDNSTTDADNIPQTHTQGDNTPKDRPVLPKITHTSTNTATGDGRIRNMLLEFGVEKDELDEAGKKVGRRKIVLKDYSYLKKDKGRALKEMSEDNFKTMLKDMVRERKKSINFDVSDDMYRQKIRKQRGK